MTPLTEDNEGQLRGGFAGLGGNDIDAQANSNCPCHNGTCTNKKCVNDACQNDTCTNDGRTEPTTPTTKPAGGDGFNGLLI